MRKVAGGNVTSRRGRVCADATPLAIINAAAASPPRLTLYAWFQPNEEVHRRVFVRHSFGDVEPYLIEHEAYTDIRPEGRRLRELVSGIREVRDIAAWRNQPTASRIGEQHPLRSTSIAMSPRPPIVVEDTERIESEIAAKLYLRESDAIALGGEPSNRSSG